ncbi:MAG TPA: DUF1214 domain-containing protein [Myxococcota bacterium]
MAGGKGSAAEAWRQLVAGLGEAGERLARATAGLAPAEQADGFRALLRALHNQLARFEVDRERPELVPFNGWRQKLFMDNPDFHYWVADVRADRRYRVTGMRGGAAFVSLTAYAASGLATAEAAARIDSDAMHFDADGRYEVVIGGARPASGDWLPLPEGARTLWVRHFHEDAAREAPGRCTIEPLDDAPPPPFIEPERFARALARRGAALPRVVDVWSAAEAEDRKHPNQVRHWSEMQGGAAFTEPGIHYQRGAWQLAPGEALVLEGEAVACRYWNALLYSRFLNSLDYRHRKVSLTGPHIPVRDGRYRLVLAAENPGVPGWLDTEGRPFGLFVLRWLRPAQPPPLPAVRVVPLAEVRSLA